MMGNGVRHRNKQHCSLKCVHKLLLVPSQRLGLSLGNEKGGMKSLHYIMKIHFSSSKNSDQIIFNSME